MRRAESEADWVRFQEDADLYPCLEWVPTTSANPGADHRPFWGTVLPIDDEFWTEHRPGDRWNCKCSLRQTDKSPTRTPSVKGERYAPSRGLKSKPGSGEIFSDDHLYFPEDCHICPFGGGLRGLWADLKGRKRGNCMKCVQDCHDGKTKKSERQRIEENKKLYDRLSKDKRYKDVEFDETTGGVKATHIGHNLDKVGGKYELDVQYSGYKTGHVVILENEKGEGRHTEGLWDGALFEVAGCETGSANNILRGLKHCASKRETEFAVIVLPNTDFDKVVFETAIKRFKGLEKLNDGQYLKFKKIICVHNQEVVYITDGI